MIYLLFLSYLLQTILHTEIHPVQIGETEIKIIKQEGKDVSNASRNNASLQMQRSKFLVSLLWERWFPAFAGMTAFSEMASFLEMTPFVGITPFGKITPFGQMSPSSEHVKEQSKNFVHLHENEQTALFTAKYYIDHQGGSLVTLNHSGTRNIRFSLKGQIFEFDPNRIFTREGIRKTLLDQGHYSEEAEKAVFLFSQKLLTYLPKGKVISVHNNVDYSIKSYFPGESFFDDADAIYTRVDTNYRNFYFVTQKKDYERLVKQHFNVALQSAAATDDGSLSYYLAHQAYINVEAAFNETYAQFLMLEAA